MFLPIGDSPNLGKTLMTGGTGGVAHGAHIGGFAVGWAAAKWLLIKVSARRKT
ncbi:MAG: hypothetical protein GY719_05505 [bacterium]|nr:hypothetical protein [bacterium]